MAHRLADRRRREVLPRDGRDRQPGATILEATDGGDGRKKGVGG